MYSNNRHDIRKQLRNIENIVLRRIKALHKLCKRLNVAALLSNDIDTISKRVLISNQLNFLQLNEALKTIGDCQQQLCYYKVILTNELPNDNTIVKKMQLQINKLIEYIDGSLNKYYAGIKATPPKLLQHDIQLVTTKLAKYSMNINVRNLIGYDGAFKYFSVIHVENIKDVTNYVYSNLYIYLTYVPATGLHEVACTNTRMMHISSYQAYTDILQYLNTYIQAQKLVETC